MMLNQTTKTNLLTVAENLRKHTATTPTTSTPTKSENKQSTTDQLTALMNHRNNLLTALDLFNRKPHLKTDLNNTVHELCETMAQITVYKTLDRLTDCPKDINTSGIKKCEEMRKSFAIDMAIYRHKDTTQNYSDAFDLFNLAYMTIWEYLNSTAPLNLDDVVLTVAKKNGEEKNYTLFQTACKSIREYIHSWSKTDQYKKLHYIVGIADNGQQVTTSKRPQDDLTDITDQQKTAFFTAHGLTAREQEILNLYIKGENAESIATALNLNLRMVQRDIKTAKAKFKTANAYAEYITAKNAEKIARAKALKNPTDGTYQKIWTQAQHRTATAYNEWKKAFREENRNQ